MAWAAVAAAAGSTGATLLLAMADDAPTRMILCAGAGAFEAAHVTLTQGVFIGFPDDAAEQEKKSA